MNPTLLQAAAAQALEISQRESPSVREVLEWMQEGRRVAIGSMTRSEMMSRGLLKHNCANDALTELGEATALVIMAWDRLPKLNDVRRGLLANPSLREGTAGAAMSELGFYTFSAGARTFGGGRRPASYTYSRTKLGYIGWEIVSKRLPSAPEQPTTPET